MRFPACAFAIAVIVASGLGSQALSAGDTLRLAGAYVERFIGAFSNVVAGEL
jgi:hypothetical protein